MGVVFSTISHTFLISTGAPPDEAGDSAELENGPVRDHPRSPEYRRHLEAHRRELAERDRFGFVIKAPVATYDSLGRYAGFGGDIIIPLEHFEKFNLAVGGMYYPFEEMGETGLRIDALLDFCHVSAWASFRLGAYAELPRPGEISENYESIAAGAMGESLFTLIKLGPARLGIDIIAGIGGTKGGLHYLAGGSTFFEYHF